MAPVRVVAGCFPFSKNSGLKFRKFYVPNGTVHSGCKDPTQATARLVIVLVNIMPQSGTEDNNFVKWKRTFRSDRPKWPERSKRFTFKAGPEYSRRPNRNVRKFGLNGKPLLCKFWLSLCLICVYFYVTVRKVWWIPINLEWNMVFELVYATLLAKTRRSLRSPLFPAAIYTGRNLLALRCKQFSVFLVRYFFPKKTESNLSNKMLCLLLLL